MDLLLTGIDGGRAQKVAGGAVREVEAWQYVNTTIDSAANPRAGA